MKKHLLTLAAIITGGALALAQAPVYRWADMVYSSTSAGNNAIGLSINKAGDIYWLNENGSTEANPTVSFNGESLYNGAPYNAGNSYASNLTLIKTDADGNKLWCVHTNSGDIASGAGGVACTSDGGCVVAVKIRHTDGMTDKDIMLTDAAGTETPVSWTCDRRYYSMLVFKVSASGEIEWNHLAEVSTTPGEGAGSKDFLADCFNLGNIAVDDNDNIYLGLNIRNDFGVRDPDGHFKVFSSPSAAKSWNGDSQTTAGDFLLLSLDSFGWYRNSLQLEGTAAVSYCQGVEYKDGAVYANGYITGDGTTLKAGDCVLTPSTVFSPLVLRADTDLNVSWAKCFPGEKVGNSATAQNCGLTAVGDVLWYCGMYNLKFSDPANSGNFLTSTSANPREGFILKLDANNGEWLAAANSRDDKFSPDAYNSRLTGYFKVLQADRNASKIMVFGYGMYTGLGAFFRTYDAGTLQAYPDESYTVVYGNMPTVQAVAYNPETADAYFTARGRNAFTLMGREGSLKYGSSWQVLMTKYTLPDFMMSGVKDIAADTDTTEAPAEYFDLQGRRVVNPAPGLYIVRRGSHTSKAVIR